MIYSSTEFLALLLVVIPLYSLFPSVGGRYAVLLLSSFVFFLWGGLAGISLFVAEVALAYLVLRACQYRPGLGRYLIPLFIVALVLNLAFWKYAPWLSRLVVRQFPDTGWKELTAFPLPLAISFFTLQCIAYIVDWRRGEIDRFSLRELALFLGFFPHLVAGPIVRWHELIPQLRRMPSPSAEDRRIGAFRFLLGFAKKLCVADTLASLVDPVFAAPADFSRAGLALAALGYTVQIWADFSGYCDMGIGVARALGFRIPENFLSPYFAVRPSEFWKRWHVTLSQWIRDYVYIPLQQRLGSRRRGSVRALAVVVATMLISGLWHGAGNTFLLWGLLHGLMLCCERLPWRRGIGPGASRPGWLAFSWLATQLGVVVGWVLFRSTSVGGFLAFGRSFLTGSGHERVDGRFVLLCSLVCFAVDGTRMFYVEGKRLPRLGLRIPALGAGLGVLAGALAATWVLYSLATRASVQPMAFIYFNF